MSNNFSKILIHLILAVKNPEAQISNGVKKALYKHINDIIKNKDQALLAINGMPDHVHIFVGLNTDVKVSDLVRNIKSDSSRFINGNKLCRNKFHWQQGYGAFSYGQSQKDDVISYILNQEQHHVKYSFKQEFIEILRRFQIKRKKLSFNFI